MTNLQELQEMPTVVSTEGLKLIKNKTYYNWEIKIKELDPDKIEKINNEMMAKFGGDFA